MKKLCLIILTIILMYQSSENKTISMGSFLPTSTFIKRSNGDTIHGIDISFYQKDISWSKIKGVDFIFIKATEGVSLQDIKFSKNWDSAKRHKFLRGAYHFYRPYVTAEDQFENFKSVVKLESGDLPPVLDAEVHSRNSTKLISDYKKWLILAENHYGVRPIIYCNSSFYRKYFSDPYFEKYPFWIANYVTNDIDRVHDNWHFWQHTCYGRLSGISTFVDKNFFNGSYDSLLSLCKK